MLRQFRATVTGAICHAAILLCSAVATAAEVPETDVHAVEAELIAWRRDIHQHPELGNRETRTAALVARELRGFGIDVREGIAVTGVLGVLRGGQPGQTIALRADMDALPVTEPAGLPFASTATTVFRDIPSGVMHACGHDAHVAILLATAKLLATHRDTLSGTVLFVFQPAEEGAPDGETGGAGRMLDEGVFADHKPAAIFGLHVASSLHAGEIGVRSGPMMAASDDFLITVHGKQTHGGRPWLGIDPITVASQIVLGANSIIARQTDLATAPAVLSFGAIHGGLRENIVPAEVVLRGTIRTFTPEARTDIAARLKNTAGSIATASGASADVTLSRGYPVLVNNAALSTRAIERFRTTFPDRVVPLPFITSSEDFALFAEKIPGFFFRLGVTPADRDPATAPTNHSPDFFVDESGLLQGVRAFIALVDMMSADAESTKQSH